MKQRIIALLKKWWFWVIAIVVILIGRSFFGGSGPVPEFSAADVLRNTLVQSVSETGTVAAELDIRYGFEVNGRIAQVYKKAGDEVKKGELIARLENAKQRSVLGEAVRRLRAAQAALNLQEIGVSEEEKRKAQALVDQKKAQLQKTEAASDDVVADAKKALETAENNLQLALGGDNSQIVDNAYEDLVNRLKISMTAVANALTESDNIIGIENKEVNDDFETALGGKSPTTLFSAQTSFIKTRAAYNTLESSVYALLPIAEHNQVDAVIPGVQALVSQAQGHLVDMQRMLVATRAISGLSEAQLDTFKSDINTELSAVNTASLNLTNDVQAVDTARNSLNSYQIAYDKAESDLETTKRSAQADIDIAKADLAQAQAAYDDLVTPPRAVDLASLRADVSRTSASVAVAQSDVAKTELRALADGVIGKLDTVVGENVTANTDLVALISPEKTVEVDISESDIAKVSLGDPVEMTLDAFGEDTLLTGTVVSVEPGETEISGVIYYKTDIVFDDTTELPIRSGMTANVQILTDKKEGVLIVPLRAILREGDDAYVRILKNEKTAEFEKRPVTTGLRGDNGQTEITSGLEEGERIITFIREVS